MHRVPQKPAALRHPGRGRRVAWAVALTALLPGTAGAAPEMRVDFLHPAGARAGTTATLQAGGHFTSWPVRVWAPDAGLRILAGDAPGHFRAELAPDLSPGPRWVRFFDDAGASAPVLFVVGDSPELTAGGGGTNLAEEAGLAFAPCVLNSLLEQPGETHAWPLRTPAACTLRLEAVATRLDAPAGVALRLLDPEGFVLAASTNTPPADADLQCLLTLPGTYRIEVRTAVRTAGTGGSIPSSPPLPVACRIVVTATDARDSAPAVPPGTWLEGAPLPDFDTRLIVRETPVTAPQPALHPETQSPADDRSGTFGGFINPPGDEDRYGFVARRDEIHRFQLRKSNPDAAFLPFVRVLHGTNVLAESSPGPGVAVVWIAPADGAYTLAVGDLAGGGGPDCAYELDWAPPEPQVLPTLADHTFTVAAGAALRIPVTVPRPASVLNRMFIVSTAGLPPDVLAGSAVLEAGGDTAVIEVRAPPEAAPSSGPFTVAVLDPLGAPPRAWSVVAPVVGRHTPPGGLLLNETGVFWLTVR